MMIQIKIVDIKPLLSPESIRVVKVGVLSKLIIVIAASLKQKTSFIIVIYSFISFFFIFS